MARGGRPWRQVCKVFTALLRPPITIRPRARRSYVLKSDAASVKLEVEARKKIGWNRHGNFVLEVPPAHATVPSAPIHTV